MYKISAKILIICAMVVHFGAAIAAETDITANICELLKAHPSWYTAAQKTEKKWGTPVNVQMAIIHQESHFKPTARPSRSRVLKVVPWKHPSSAYGYAQVLDKTWRAYMRDTHHRWARRDSFDDAVDFIGWYTKKFHDDLGISQIDAEQLYIAYYEGTGGYKHRKNHQPEKIQQIAHSVQRFANQYQSQMDECQSALNKKSWW